MNNFSTLMIFLSFVGLWFTSILPEKYETFFGFILIFTFGILHGSNDIVLIKNIKKEINFLNFINLYEFIYSITILFTALLFYFFPEFALLIFIICSAYHFGEQHWYRHKLLKNKFFEKIFFFNYGLIVLFLVFVANDSSVIEIIASITGLILNKIIFIYSFYILFFLLIMFFIYSIVNKNENYVLILRELFFLLIFWIIFKSSSLIWGFSIYFIFWHSIPSLYEQIEFMYSEISKPTILAYFKSAFKNWIISILGFGIFYYILRDEKMLNSIFFSFIAAITFPHAVVITTMFSKKNNL